MHWAKLKDGREVIVSAQKTRQVGGEEFFIPNNYVVCLLDGAWQPIRKDKLRALEYGNPFQDLRR
jgi:hypothetical protein